ILLLELELCSNSLRDSFKVWAVRRNPFGILLLELELCSNSLRDSFKVWAVRRNPFGILLLESGFWDEIPLGVFSGNGNAHTIKRHVCGPINPHI
ncbi:MAG: hypothetical protein SGI71_03710, partial [Verrucomicrobiota bacterium]|nr:hypothetical protein [Verrucomicrobiota bacterium]